MTTTLTPALQEQSHRDAVIADILSAIRTNRVIKLPDFDRNAPTTTDFPLAAIGPNQYSGTLGPYLYQFEGEEDLLHLFVIRRDEEKITVEEAQQVVSFLYGPVPKALVWLRPGEYSQHFYIGHDDLLEYL